LDELGNAQSMDVCPVVMPRKQDLGPDPFINDDLNHTSFGGEQVLHEAKQFFADGRSRCRNIPLSEKLLPNEDAVTAARRGILEELGGVISGPDAICLSNQWHSTCAGRVSKSYPGLKSNVCSSSDSGLGMHMHTSRTLHLQMGGSAMGSQPH
jgi:hypothetical protein